MSEEIANPSQMEMFKEVEQDENVPRGYVKVIQIIPYDVVGKTKDDDGKEKPIEKGRRPYFCQDREDLQIFKETATASRLETFEAQLLKSSAIKYINDPENMKQFRRSKK